MKKLLVSIMVAVFMLTSLTVTVNAEECMHTYSVTEFDVVTHTETCELCGNVQTSVHTWSNYTLLTGDGKNHHANCTVCGQKNVQSHNWYADGKVMLIFNAVSCDGCATEQVLESAIGFTYDGSDLASTCSHNWGVISYDNEQHSLVCHSCGTAQAGAHSWNEGTVGSDGNSISYTCSGGCVKIENAVIDWENSEYPVETYYTIRGSHDINTVTYAVTASGKDYDEHKIWYPADLETLDQQYPVIVFCNGSGSSYEDGTSDPEGYNNLFEHIASWGYILVANNDQSAGNGDSASESLDQLLSENENSESIFYGKVDTSRIVAAGHSQGGSGTFNIASEGKYTNSSLIKAIYSASAPSEELAASWLQNTPYDASLVKVPAFLTASTGNADHSTDANSTDGICRLDGSLRQNVDSIKANNVAVIMARRNGDGIDHGQMLYIGKGYMIAWFEYILYGDEFASQAFVGNNPEILRNSNWQDGEIHNIVDN